MYSEKNTDLLNVIEKETEVLTSLEKLLQKEKEILLKDDAKQLNFLVEEKNIEILKLEKLQAERNDVVENSDISHEKIAKATELLQDKIIKINELQETNLLLTEQSIAYQNMVMCMVQDVISKSGNYSKEGRIENKPIATAGLDKSV